VALQVTLDHRVALQVTLGHPVAPLHVISTCVEWEPEYLDDHLAQTRKLARLLADPALDGPLPIVLTADLNAPPETPQLRPLTEIMVDTWIAGDGDPQAVTLSSQNPWAPMDARRQIDRRIDYILLRPGNERYSPEVKHAFLARDPVDGLHPSDHYAVVADIAP
jgi:endonuclease/exonuclease/phosphatase family metal-dependent hydrolase